MQKLITTIVLGVALTFQVGAETGTNAPTERTMTLEECIQTALKHNFDVQINKLGPEISRMTLSIAYGNYYDPTLSLSAKRNFDHTPSYNEQSFGNFAINENEGFSDQVSGSVGAYTPWGMRYSLNTSLSIANSSGLQNNIPYYSKDQYRGGANINLTQPLLKNAWIDPYRYQIQISKKDIKTSEYAYLLTLMRTINQVETTYFDLINNRGTVVAQMKSLELSERLLAENKKRVEVGAMAPLDEKQAASYVARDRASVIAAQQTVSNTENALKQLMSDEFTGWQDAVIAPSDTPSAVASVFSRQDSWNKGLNSRPDLIQAKLDVERMNITLKYKYNQLFPSLDLSGTFGYNAVDSGFDRMSGTIGDGQFNSYSVGAVFNIPLGNISARKTYAISKAQKKQTLLRLKQMEQTIMVDIDNAIKAAQSGYERIEATKQARLYAEAAYDAAQKKLEVGKATTYEVLQLQNELTSARINETGALTAYNKALSNLAFSEGYILEKNRIDVNFK